MVAFDTSFNHETLLRYWQPAPLNNSVKQDKGFWELLTIEVYSDLRLKFHVKMEAISGK